MAAPLKVGMLGTRGIARNHMTPYLTHSDQVRMTAVCDMVEPLAREYAKDAGVEDVYTDFDDMLRNADIDAVDICTNHAAHAHAPSPRCRPASMSSSRRRWRTPCRAAATWSKPPTRQE